MSVVDVSSGAVLPVTAGRWHDLAALFERAGPRGGTPLPAGCWCQFWHLRGRAFTAGWGVANRSRLEEQVLAGSEPGLLAYDAGGTPVGWCRVGPRSTFDRLEASRALARVDDEEPWSVVCFYVHPSAKRQGVASALLEGAVAHAAARGARVVEGYAARPGHVNIDAYTGYLPMFLRAGFEPVREGGRRTIVRRQVGAGGRPKGRGRLEGGA